MQEITEIHGAITAHVEAAREAVVGKSLGLPPADRGGRSLTARVVAAPRY